MHSQQDLHLNWNKDVRDKGKENLPLPRHNPLQEWIMPHQPENIYEEIRHPVDQLKNIG